MPNKNSTKWKTPLLMLIAYWTAGIRLYAARSVLAFARFSSLWVAPELKDDDK